MPFFKRKKTKVRPENIGRFYADGQPAAEEHSYDDDTNYQQDLTFDLQTNPYFDTNPEGVLISWQGPEYEDYPKGRNWYLVAAGIIALIVAYAVITDSPLMAIVFILIGIIGFVYLQTGPRLMEFGITEDGIIAGNELFEYDDIASFWIFYEPPHTRVISLHMKGRLVPFIHIPLHQRDPVDVRDALLQFIPEKKQQPNVIDTIERLLHI